MASDCLISSALLVPALLKTMAELVIGTDLMRPMNRFISKKNMQLLLKQRTYLYAVIQLIARIAPIRSSSMS